MKERVPGGAADRSEKNAEAVISLYRNKGCDFLRYDPSQGLKELKFGRIPIVQEGEEGDASKGSVGSMEDWLQRGRVKSALADAGFLSLDDSGARELIEDALAAGVTFSDDSAEHEMKMEPLHLSPKGELISGKNDVYEGPEDEKNLESIKDPNKLIGIMRKRGINYWFAGEAGGSPVQTDPVRSRFATVTAVDRNEGRNDFDVPITNAVKDDLADHGFFYLGRPEARQLIQDELAAGREFSWRDWDIFPLLEVPGADGKKDVYYFYDRRRSFDQVRNGDTQVEVIHDRDLPKSASDQLDRYHNKYVRDREKLQILTMTRQHQGRGVYSYELIGNVESENKSEKMRGVSLKFEVDQDGKILRSEASEFPLI